VPVYEYVGADRGPVTEDGFASVGDLGWLDEDGYLFIADRRTDLIISGGVNVYPAEVEAALTEHPAVVDAAVVGVPDDEWGRRVHAVVEVLPGAAVTPEELDAHCRARLSATKVPRSYDVTTDLGRNEAGKLRRSGLSPSG
jgi:bile acid-coenzyme A ligase